LQKIAGVGEKAKFDHFLPPMHKVLSAQDMLYSLIQYFRCAKQ